MFLARMALFRLYESPRFLVHAGRHREAVDILRLISRFNGLELAIGLEDVQDERDQHVLDSEDTTALDSGSESTMRGTSIDVDAEQSAPTRSPSRSTLRNSGDRYPPDYSSTSVPNIPPQTHVDSHTEEDLDIPHGSESVSLISATDVEVAEEYHKDTAHVRTRTRTSSPSPSYVPRRTASRMSRASSLESMKARYWRLPRRVRRPLLAWADRVALVLSPDWARTTLLVWTVWTLMSLGESHDVTFVSPRASATAACSFVLGSIWCNCVRAG